MIQVITMSFHSGSPLTLLIKISNGIKISKHYPRETIGCWVGALKPTDLTLVIVISHSLVNT